MLFEMFQAYRLIDNGDSLMVFREHLLSIPLSGHYFERHAVLYTITRTGK